MPFKKNLATAGCVLGLIATAAVFAGGPGEFDPPTEPHHFYFYGEGMLAQASEDGGFAVTKANPPGGNDVLHHNSQIAFGGTVGGSYIFDNQSDIRAEYTYLPGEYSNVKETGQNPRTFTMEKTYQAVNIDLGQYWRPVPKLSLHFFAGIAYRNYEHSSKHPYQDSNRYTGTTGNGTFNGWGPRFGIDSFYEYFSWLNLVANVAMSLPYGSMDADAIESAGTKVETKNIDKFVPELAGNIGLQLNHDFGKSWWGGLEVGYRAIHLMNSDIDLIDLSNKTASSSGFNFHDTTFYGPYLRLSVMF